MKQIEIYKTKDGKTQIEVNFDKETIWLNQLQLAELFKTDRTSLQKHLKNIYATGELDAIQTCAKFAQVRLEGKKQVKREILHYNLDAILSAGYRVNSKRGTQFRIWATQRLNEYLVKGYSVNQKRLSRLQKTIQFISKTGTYDNLNLAEAKGLLEIISKYTKSLVVLNRYDSKSLGAENLTEKITYEINYKQAHAAIEKVKSSLIGKKVASDFFGNQKDESFKGILGNIVQTFGSVYLYPSIEEQAAHLLYFVIKNHPFSVGNKRIGAFLFIWFLDKNKHLFSKSGEVKINESTLVALALLVAQSNPEDKVS